MGTLKKTKKTEEVTLLLCAKDVSRMIGVTPNTIHKWTRDGRFIEPMREGARVLRWEQKWVEQWVAAHRRWVQPRQ